IAVEGNDPGFIAGRCGWLRLGRIQRFEVGGRPAQSLRSSCNDVPVIPRGFRNHTGRARILISYSDGVISSPELDRANFLQVLALEKNLCIKTHVKRL